GVARPWYLEAWGVQVCLLLVTTLAVGYVVVRINILELVDEDSFYPAMRMFGQLFRADWSILPKAILKIIETVYIAFMATALAIPIAFVLSFLSAKNIMSKLPWGMPVYTFLRIFFNISRSIEPILWAILFSIWVGFGPFAGMLALMVHSVASLAKLYSEIV